MAAKTRAPGGKAKGKEPDPWWWIPANDRRFTVRGLPWFEENQRVFHRLPARAADKVNNGVTQLHKCPASANIAFRTDSTDLAVRVANPDAAVMDHMPATGSRGVALYGGSPGQMRPWGVARPATEARFQTEFFRDRSNKVREFRFYLPLYKSLESLEIGLCKGARILKPTPLRIPRPVVFYGTSITQGGCASSAGSDFVSTLGRMLNIETVNLGFSGSGRGEPIIAELMSEVDASLYVLDYAANVKPDRLRWTLPRLYAILRRKHPDTPILLMSRVCYWRYDWDPAARRDMEDTRDVMLDVYVQKRKRGDRNLHFADGSALIPFATEGAYCDGVHPSDHGFQMMATRLAPILERILFLNEP